MRTDGAAEEIKAALLVVKAFQRHSLFQEFANREFLNVFSDLGFPGILAALRIERTRLYRSGFHLKKASEKRRILES